jgi:hypothetical protein
VQVGPINIRVESACRYRLTLSGPLLEIPWSQRLKLEHDEPLANIDSKLMLRRYPPAGAAIAPGSSASVDLPVIITPIDVRGNQALLADADPARFTLSVSPSSLAVLVSSPTLDGLGNLHASWKATAAGRAVQVEPMQPVLQAPGPTLLKLGYDCPLSNLAFQSILRRYTPASSSSASSWMAWTSSHLPG